MAMEKLRKRQFTFSTGYLLLAIAVLWAVQAFAVAEPRPKTVPYSELLEAIEGGKAKEATLRTSDVVVVLRAPEGGKEERISASRLPGIDETALLQKMRDHGVVFSGRVEDKGFLTTFLYGWVLPFGLMFGLYLLVMRRLGKGAGPLSFGKATPKIHDLSERDRATFADVAGVDEAKAELVEIVSYLKTPEKYRAVGARAPKGVLLVGPPGTGKTLLARAVAGEAGVPFFSISGSEFVQMFVGVGAARVRDLFEQAKERAPCIIFIDELDAIGRARAGAAGGFAVHEEREQTLNQILVEMDGFDASRGVVILAATNRPEVLDAALLRAGRFDRQVLVDRPDVRGREAILGVHAKKLKTRGADLSVVAQRTPGMTGADLANVVNEAALAAARRGGEEVEARDFEEAVDRIQLGLKKQGTVMTEDERRRVAVHEAGHALVALRLPHADPVHRVTIIPRSIGALGATLQLPVQDRYLLTRAELIDRICVLLGGRAAEEVALGEISTGAQNDLERATETARLMVTRFGMSERLGPLTYAPREGRFVDLGVGEPRTGSEETARVIDEEVRALVEGEHQRARKLLSDDRAALERIAARLVERETLDRAELEGLV